MAQLKLRQDIVRTELYSGPAGWGGRCVYWDEALESFGLRMYPTGWRVYVCTYQVNQHKRLATLGRADAMSLDQARKKAMTYLAQGCELGGPAEPSRRAAEAQDDRRSLRGVHRGSCEQEKETLLRRILRW